jgi:hypothetical protein
MRGIIAAVLGALIGYYMIAPSLDQWKGIQGLHIEGFISRALEQP